MENNRTFIPVQPGGEELQEIMGQVPSTLVRWGNSILLLLVVSLLLATYFVSFPERITGRFQLEKAPARHPVRQRGLTARPLYGVIRVGQKRAGKIEPGQTVLLKFDSYPVDEFGAVGGKVIRIADTSDSTGQWLIDVVLPNGLLTTRHQQLPHRTDMLAQADIVLEDVRLIHRIIPGLGIAH